MKRPRRPNPQRLRLQLEIACGLTEEQVNALDVRSVDLAHAEGPRLYVYYIGDVETETVGSSTWTAPAATAEVVTVECWGGGGGGCSVKSIPPELVEPLRAWIGDRTEGPLFPTRAKKRRRLPIFFERDQGQKLLDACTAPRDRMIVELGFFSGLRVSEITGLRVEHVRLDRGLLEVHGGKGDKDRNLPIPERLMDPLRQWIGDRSEGWLFPSPYGGRLSARTVQRLFKAAAKRAGLPGADQPRKATPHKMRHSYATWLLDNGANIREVQELLGHASVATTEVYTHVRADRLRGAVSRL